MAEQLAGQHPGSRRLDCRTRREAERPAGTNRPPRLGRRGRRARHRRRLRKAPWAGGWQRQRVQGYGLGQGRAPQALNCRLVLGPRTRRGGPETLGQGTAGLGSQPVAGVDAGGMAARQARYRWQRRVGYLTASIPVAAHFLFSWLAASVASRPSPSSRATCRIATGPSPSSAAAHLRAKRDPVCHVLDTERR